MHYSKSLLLVFAFMSSHGVAQTSRYNVEVDYLTWINTHPYGQKEKVHPNNHGVCWSMQAAAFADLLTSVMLQESIPIFKKETYETRIVVYKK